MPTFDFPKTEAGKRPVMLLTGASRGIGHATVMQFAMAGWRILSCSRQAFSEKCPWPSGADDHIQIDLGDPEDTMRGIAEIKKRLAAEGGKLNALVNNAGISPKGPKGERLGAATTSFNDWHKVFQVNFFAPIMLARGLLDELTTAKGAIVNVTSIAGSRVHPFAGAAYATSKAALASLTREMAADFGPARHPRELDLAGRDRHRHPLAGHREDRRDPADEAARQDRRGRQGDLFPLHGLFELRHRLGTAHQRRAARLTQGAAA